MIEEEKRADRNRKAFANKKKPIGNIASKIELPPKTKKMEMAMDDSD